MTTEVFDEEISLRRIEVALKRADWRMFGDAVTRLEQELAAGSPFARFSAWRDLARRAAGHEELPDEHKAALRDAVARVLAIDARVLSGVVAAAVADRPALVVVDMWRSGLDAPATREAFRRWLGRRPCGPFGEGVSLAELAARAQLAAGEAGWVETFFAGLGAVLAPPALGELPEGAVALTVDPAATGGLRLAGALDEHWCPACRTAAAAPPRALVTACPGCAGPARPMIAPTTHGDWLPPPLRRRWELAADLLRDAPTWALVAPPVEEDWIVGWLLDRMAAGRRVLVVGDEACHAPWRARLAAHEAAEIVTARGPIEETLPFLLAGGTAERPAPAFAGKKKRR